MYMFMQWVKQTLRAHLRLNFILAAIFYPPRNCKSLSYKTYTKNTYWDRKTRVSSRACVKSQSEGVAVF